ncbi:Na+/H+ antiporter NhaC family protein [Salicibibacter cibi]|uniref:Na+/H+ antiporter NhaC family protein n=1 Tax=Salicibibacter cibi TaxID=2743001 RepID=A0A7T7CEJ6_9BACI|nr:Na+/H+ antiporter NhaC family protein [Salicibibacter cibi]QQK79113.1 Na+/H+ antiporter NhaC family protein [Salicibibacter cibi]
MEFGVLSLLPPMLAIILAIITRNVIPSLFAGVWIGATMLADWNPLAGIYVSFQNFIIPVIGDEGNATILVYVALFGVLIAFFQRTGGAEALAEFISEKVKSRRGAQGGTGGLGILLFIDDYFNALTAGSVMRAVTDRMKVSREKLAYIVDSTSAPTALLVPVSTWVVFVMGLISAQFAEIGISQSEYFAYLSTIPFNFYSIFAVLFVFVIIYLKLDYGPMAKAEFRTMTTGKVQRDGAQPPSADEITQAEPMTSKPKLMNLLIPLIVLLAMIPPLFLWTGGYPENDFVTAIGEADGAISILLAAFTAGILGLIMGLSQKLFSFKEAISIYMGGIKGMVLVFLILILAWSIGDVASEVGTAEYVSNLAQQLFTPAIIPALIFIVSGIVAFTAGTSYGTFAIMIPIAMPIAASLDISMPLVIAAVLSGGVFGDHCSPISDTTVLSSAGSSCDLVDHVYTQLPYALTAGVSGIIAFVIAGYTESIWLSLAVGIIALILLAFLLNRMFGQKMPKEQETNA